MRNYLKFRNRSQFLEKKSLTLGKKVNLKHSIVC